MLRLKENHENSVEILSFLYSLEFICHFCSSIKRIRMVAMCVCPYRLHLAVLQLMSSKVLFFKARVSII